MEKRDALPARLVAAYQRTVYCVDGVTFRCGRRQVALAQCLGRHRCAVFLSAWNPRSRLHPAAWNRRAEARLIAALGRRPWLYGEGRFGRWREAHVLALGDKLPYLRLARRFRQNAVIVVARDLVPRLVVLV